MDLLYTHYITIIFICQSYFFYRAILFYAAILLKFLLYILFLFVRLYFYEILFALPNDKNRVDCVIDSISIIYVSSFAQKLHLALVRV